MGKNAGESTDCRAETFYNIMYGEIYMTARRGGGRRFTTRRCSVLAVHVSTCSRAKDMVLQQRGGRRLMTLTSILYKTRAYWPPQYAEEEEKPTFKRRSSLKNWKRSRSKNWKRSRLKYSKYKRGSTADLTRAVRNGRES